MTMRRKKRKRRIRNKKWGNLLLMITGLMGLIFPMAGKERTEWKSSETESKKPGMEETLREG